MNIKILQINLGRGREAQQLMINNIMEKEVDIAIISEQYATVEGSAWYQDVLGKASVYIRNQLLTIEKIEENNEHFVVIHTNRIRIYRA